jgi:biopolymer transport protein ExbB
VELSFLELWETSGALVRGVVGVLGVMSVAAGAVAADKWLRLRRAERESAAFLAAWRAAGDPAVAARLAARHPASPVAALVARASDAAPVAAAEGARREIHDRTVRGYVLATGAELRRGLGVLATVGSTAPFVGLFGTVVGIVNAFHEIGATGHGGIAVVSTGIAEALIATAVGILVAIPAVWLFNHLSQRIARLLAAVECAGEELAVARLRHGDGAAGGAPSPPGAGAASEDRPEHAGAPPARVPSWR